jgi:uncharacterized membrane protein
MDKIIRHGRFIFAIAILALGVENVVNTRLGLWQTIDYEGHLTLAVIPWVPAYAWLGYLMGLFLIAAALSFIANYHARTTALALGSVFLIRMLFRVGSIFVERTIPFEQIVIAGAAFTLAGTLTSDEHYLQPWAGVIDVLTKSGRYLFAVASIVFGIDHFVFFHFVASLIPFYIPWHEFWTALTGAGFIATGLAFIAAGFNPAFRWLAKLSGFMLGVMFGLWFVLLHAPRVLGVLPVPGKIAPRDPNEWSSAFIALAICGGAWICAWAFAIEMPLRLRPVAGQIREPTVVNR